jgi:hypothetical protein
MATTLITDNDGNASPYRGLAVQGGRAYVIWTGMGGQIISIGADASARVTRAPTLGALTVVAVDATDVYA